MTVVGRMGLDKSQGDYFVLDPVTMQQARELWQGNDLAAKIIEKVPDEALRPGFQVSVGGDGGGEIKGEIEEGWKNLLLRDRLWQAYAWMRGFGGGAVLLGADDGAKKWEIPLNEERVRSFDWTTALEPDDLTPADYYDDPQRDKGKYGEVRTYNLAATRGTALKIHESRLIVFRGVQVSRHQQKMNNGWPDSILTRVKRVLNNHDMTWDSAAILMRDFAQAVMKIKGLAELILKGKDDVILRRLKAVALARSVAGAILMDTDEEFERQQTPITGLAEALDKWMVRLSAAGDIPVTFMYGISPAGLNATGASDITSFYDRIKVIEDLDFLPAIERVVRLQLVAMGVQPEQWSVSFNPLMRQTDMEKAETRKTVGETDVAYINAGVVPASVVARARYGGDEWSMDIHLDKEELNKIELEEQQPDPAPLGPDGKPIKPRGTASAKAAA
jgi:uncharacterized protein